jgi:hypothetical protein
MPAQDLGVGDGEGGYHYPQKSHHLDTAGDGAEEGGSSLGELDAEYVGYGQAENAHQTYARYSVKPVAERIDESFQALY